ncbi:hypothetical protein [Singulisphaera acidiphila]|uniref:Uncharacterized protein n=1 Tax=Singulisphaera acidiphila (strain ATCC BAA-1392 / DSM 18658 / VKM B-2454 / MOB10) TaxID=886293 RepID=L0D554_SINAD|nr:hypothetical protein [Singulisphaera acidiphila]AGA24569.1 hypothetical protein Sinac_0109 [Singulisphaera acidiphila DSM 18658]
MKTITIAKADDYLDEYGLHVLVSNPGSIVARLQVYTGEDPCGIDMAGLVQQKLTNQVVNGEQLKDKDWHPNAPGSTLNLVDAVIYDEVGSMADADAFAALPEENVFFSATQAFRILYSTPCGETLEMPLGEWTIMKRKKSATQWQCE